MKGRRRPVEPPPSLRPEAAGGWGASRGPTIGLVYSLRFFDALTSSRQNRDDRPCETLHPFDTTRTLSGVDLPTFSRVSVSQSATDRREASSTPSHHIGSTLLGTD